MDYSCAVYVSFKEFMFLNAPFVIVNTIANIFYAFCLIFPPHKRRLKQPLSFLLGFLVWCSIQFCVGLVVLILHFGNIHFSVVLQNIILCFVDHSMTCYVWLNFYYYIQIVPVQCLPLVWVKKNIKTVIYMFLALEVTVFSFYGAVSIFHDLFLEEMFESNANQTMSTQPIEITKFVFYSITRLYVFVCLCISLLSSFSTIHYLHKHVKSVAQSGTSFTPARLQSQIRVTITGIYQGLFYLLFSIYYVIDSVTQLYGTFYFSPGITFTITSLYISGTTVTLGVGQAVFRERISSLWKVFKALTSDSSIIKQRNI